MLPIISFWIGLQKFYSCYSVTIFVWLDVESRMFKDQSKLCACGFLGNVLRRIAIYNKETCILSRLHKSAIKRKTIYIVTAGPDLIGTVERQIQIAFACSNPFFFPRNISGFQQAQVKLRTSGG